MTMYASTNFKSKKAFKEAVAEGKRVTVRAAGLGEPPVNGTAFVSGPWYPAPHKWDAEVTVQNGIVTKVK